MSNQVNFYTTTLAQSLSAGGSDTEIFVSSVQTIDGETLTTADFAALGAGYLTVDPQSSQRCERIKFTTVNATDVAFTGATRGLLNIGGAGNTTDNAFYHPVGSAVVISFGADDINDIITYVNDTAFAGAPNASPTVKGIVQEATQAQVDGRTVAGSTGADLYMNPGTQRSTLKSDYVADTGSANVYAIAPSPAITAYAVGQEFTFKAAHANTSTSTLNVNGLGAKSIMKQGGGTALVTGDIALGQIVQVEYDGTNFQMLNPIGQAGANKIMDYQAFTANGTWTKPSGLTGTELVIAQLWGGGAGGGSASATGSPTSAGGGGGGAFGEFHCRASDLGSTETITVAAAVAAATAGNTTSFGSHFSAFGGGPGATVAAASSQGGGGGGGGLNAAGSAGTASGTGGSATGGPGGGFAGGAANSDGPSGGAGGSTASFNGTTGGSVNGGGGGGNGNVGGLNGAAGGNSINGGAGGGGVNNGVSAAGGTSKYGGNGGASVTPGNGTTGVAGTAPGGGGGGGGMNGATGSSTGGGGARGEVRIWVIRLTTST